MSGVDLHAEFAHKLAEAIDTLPDSHPSIHRRMKRCSDSQLFWIALFSEKNWGRALSFLRTHTRQISYKEDTIIRNRGSGLTHLPSELLTEIAKHLNLRDLNALGTACKTCSLIANAHVDLSTQQLATSFDLRLDELRFALQQCEAFVTGSIAIRALFPGKISRGVAETDTMQIYIERGSEKAMLRYFEVATGYVQRPAKKFSRLRFTRVDVIELRHANKKRYKRRIILRVCGRDAPPLVELFRQKTTAHFTLLCGAGVFTAYAETTFKGTALPNAEFIYLDDGNDKAAVKRLKAKMAAHGIKLIAYHEDSAHVCGAHFCCPAVIRTSEDSGSFFAPFATRVLG
ncbi:hypothetical protein B0H10DRAFT_2431141, partial [Mycena sp. CBHHK59/15]